MDITVINPMTETEAREHVQQINASAVDIGRRLLELKEREGWRALGYKNWTACLNEEFVFSRKHLYSLMNAAPVAEKLLPKGYKLTTNQASTVARYPEDLQPAIVRGAKNRYGKLTESNLRRYGDTLQQAVETGYLDIRDGEKVTAFEAALTDEDVEALKRQKQYIQENMKPRPAHVNGDGEIIPVRQLTPDACIARARLLVNSMITSSAELNLCLQTLAAPRGKSVCEQVEAEVYRVSEGLVALLETVDFLERKAAA